MKRLAVLLVIVTSPALANSPDKFAACEKQHRAEHKAAKEAAPKGFVPAPVRGKRAAFMVECLAK